MICATDFEAALDANPQDWTTRQVYADFLEERGLDREAYCQRWLVRNNSRASPGFFHLGVRWYSATFWTYKFESFDAIPAEIYRWLSAEKEPTAQMTRPYMDRQAAEDDLCQALQLALRSPRKP